MKTYWTDECGLMTIEWIILLALIIVVGLTVWTALGAGVNTTAE